MNRRLLLGPLHQVTKKICLKDIILSYEVFELLHCRINKIILEKALQTINIICVQPSIDKDEFKNDQ